MTIRSSSVDDATAFLDVRGDELVRGDPAVERVRVDLELAAGLVHGVDHRRPQSGRTSGHQHVSQHQPLLDRISVVERPRWYGTTTVRPPQCRSTAVSGNSSAV